MSKKEDKLTYRTNIDFPELQGNGIDDNDAISFVDHRDEVMRQNDFLKKAMIDDIKDNIQVGRDNRVIDKRLKIPLYKRILDVLFK